MNWVWSKLTQPHIYALVGGICGVLAQDPLISPLGRGILTDIATCAMVVTTLMLQWKMEKPYDTPRNSNPSLPN